MDHRKQSLSGQQRRDKIEGASRELQSFLERLEPFVRRSICAPSSLTLEEHARWVTDAEAQTSVREARQRYERLAICIPAEWKRYKKIQGPEYITMIEWVLLKRT